MFIETSLWALMLSRTNLQELKYGYRMYISVGGFPAPLHICSLVYNKSWQNHHSCTLHVLSIHMTALYFASSPVYGFTCSRTKKKNLQQWKVGGLFSFSTEETMTFISIWAEKTLILQCGFIWTKKCLLAIVGFNFIWLYLYLSNLFRAWLVELLFPFHRLEFSETKLIEIKIKLTKEKKSDRFFLKSLFFKKCVFQLVRLKLVILSQIHSTSSIQGWVNE